MWSGELMPRGAGGAPVVVAAVPSCQLLCCGDFHGSYRLSSVHFPGMGLPPSGASLSLMLHNLPLQSGNVKANLNIYSQNM